MPSLDQALRGLALATLAAALARAALASTRRSVLIALPGAALLGAAAFLAAWAAIIHLTGGERFDDHPFL